MGKGLLAVTLALVSACSSNGPTASPATTSPATTSAETGAGGGSTTVPGAFRDAPLGRAGCQPPSPIRANEVRGTSDSAEIYGLLSRVRVGEPVKIVWRMTGSGELVVTVSGPTGEVAPLTFGPEPHGGSTYDRPGDEWGSGYRFDRPGCWHLHLERADTSGDVWLEVDR